MRTDGSLCETQNVTERHNEKVIALPYQYAYLYG